MDVIEAIRPNNIVAIITDNIVNMKKAWEEIQAIYPEVICLGCGSHMTNFLLKNIVAIPELSNCFKTTLTIITYFRTHAAER